ncbi:hypothetical protein [Paractinoplanes atraurantiacus]|uniref:Uncharacterized protein n=1 Tax=Paractinoplanes atraurantiacus TaxID=1036182 RepID=A0A285H493_9ACTN|nr:hypothetical protein [Actinoplanes atraurantiacus]SNY29321.1 hypothetical protein SAMN05421748_103230 [Actinoplanes atraurantiacus]
MKIPITLPTAGEQARHALLLLGAPAPARLVAQVHAALFDGDLSVPALAALVRDREAGLCAALDADLAAVPGLIALADWPLERRLMTPVARRACSLAMIIRVAEFIAMRASLGPAEHRLLRELAQDVPHGPESLDLAERARVALESLCAAQAAEEPLRAAALSRAVSLEAEQRLYGIPAVPHQRGRE